MKEHIVKSFDSEIHSLNEQIEKLSQACALQLSAAAEAFETLDTALARKTILQDEKLNRLHRDIEDACVKLLALRQPMATDLRYLLSSMKIAAELERIGDYAANISKRVTGMTSVPSKEPARLILKMIRICGIMLIQSIDAFFSADIEKAVDVWHKDDEIDRKFSRMMTFVHDRMQRDRDEIQDGTRLIFIGRCCERIGDHITNIAEDICYMVTGRDYMGLFEKDE